MRGLSFQKNDYEKIDSFLTTLMIVPVNSIIARVAAEVRRRHKLHLLDGMIAATALLHDAPLVTRNVKDFSSVKELEIVEI